MWVRRNAFGGLRYKSRHTFYTNHNSSSFKLKNNANFLLANCIFTVKRFGIFVLNFHLLLLILQAKAKKNSNFQFFSQFCNPWMELRFPPEERRMSLGQTDKLSHRTLPQNEVWTIEEYPQKSDLRQNFKGSNKTGFGYCFTAPLLSNGEGGGGDRCSLGPRRLILHLSKQTGHNSSGVQHFIPSGT